MFVIIECSCMSFVVFFLLGHFFNQIMKKIINYARISQGKMPIVHSVAFLLV
jgi:hypothetical protein